MSGQKITRWLLFCQCVHIFPHQEKIACVGGPRRIESIFSIQTERYNVMAEGELLGAKLRFEAKSRRRLLGDEEDSVVPLFVGTFNHTEGVSGDFQIRPRPDGELMTLGVYGAPPTFQLIKSNLLDTASPVNVLGIPGWEVRFEDPTQATREGVSFSKRELRAFGKPHHYGGYCISRAESEDSLPPMPSVLITMLLAYQLLLKEHYLRSF